MTVLRSPALARLEAQLAESIDGRCDFSEAGIALYTSDASNYRQIPLGVVFPTSIEDIVTTTKLCRQSGLPVLMRGAGTSQNGQTVNEAIILDCSQHLNRVLEIDRAASCALVEPGVVCDALKAEAEQHGLTWGPDPATHSRCTLGGMIGNNSCGPHSMLAGKTVENVLELEVLTPDGARFWVGPTSAEEFNRIVAANDRQAEIYTELKAIIDEYDNQIRAKYPNIKRRVSGYNLDQLLPENGFNVARALVGSEGTCVTILQARLNLIENPKYKRLIVLGFKDIYTAGDTVPDIMPFKPIAMEGLDWTIIGGLLDRNLRQAEVAMLPAGRAWILVELAADDPTALEKSCSEFEQAMNDCEKVQSVLQVTETDAITGIWSIREQGASATSMSLNPEDPDPIIGWEDTAVDPMRLGDYLREFNALVSRYGYTTSLYGHFGDGCIHARITFDTRSTEGVTHWRNFSKDIANLVVRYGGSLSGEHGDGQAKAEFLPIMFGEPLMSAFRRFKQAWDPELRMNPGKVIDANLMDENLRYGPDYKPANVATTLHFKEDIGGFKRTTERCIGMGKCRSATGAMCPSYQATGEERYSTRGRAHLLHELVRGEVITDGWNNTDIAESLEHCLSCKACKSECPTQVDIATYKAEFMAKHYDAVKRPLHHYPLAHIGTLLPKIATFARLVNFMQRGTSGKLTKKLLNIHDDKTLPALSAQSFSTWARENATDKNDSFYYIGNTKQAKVVLWTDSVNNHYRPEILISAANVLTKSGFCVAVAKHRFCCGRPLYEYGYLQQATRQLENILCNFHTELPETASVLVLEPSCLSVFKDELLRLYPTDPRAADLCSRTKTLSAFLIDKDFTPKKKLHHGILHIHCHDKALSQPDTDREIMHRCFDTILEPESGCCGMAGTYGIKQKTRHIGRRLFDRRLGPSIQSKTSDTIIVTNGFSCAEQILDHTRHAALHPVQVLERCV